MNRERGRLCMEQDRENIKRNKKLVMKLQSVVSLWRPKERRHLPPNNMKRYVYIKEVIVLQSVVVD